LYSKGGGGGESRSVRVTSLELTRTTGKFEMKEQNEKNCVLNENERI